MGRPCAIPALQCEGRGKLVYSYPRAMLSGFFVQKWTLTKPSCREVKAMKLFHIQKAAERVGLSPTTLRRYERAGRIEVERDDLGHRVYLEDDLKQLREISEERRQRRR